MIPDQVRALIQQGLDDIEREHAVRVLYACESGSRGWGFASKDSDYDVRFVYVHPVDWYLSVERHRDVIELPISGDLDISGWDLRKALQLLRKSNPALLEWLSSPIVYREDAPVMARFRELSREYYTPETCMRHYLHMASGNFREYLQGEKVWTKKYLYVLRPVLACRWIEGGHGPVPMAFARLLEAVAPEGPVRTAIDSLLEQKRAARELDEGDRIPVLNQFLGAEIERLKQRLAGTRADVPPTDSLDAFFRWVLGPRA